MDSSTDPPEPETATPISFANGAAKLHRSFAGAPSPAKIATYRECLKNHAAAIGGHSIDGCGEFAPSPLSTAADPASLTCAACGCHRNFHRRDGGPSPLVLDHHRGSAVIEYQRQQQDPLALDHVTRHRHVIDYQKDPLVLDHMRQHVIEYQPHHRHRPPPPPPHGSASPPPISSFLPPARHVTRKRFRTKFTAAQKRRMREFAERIGWRLQKKDEEVIREFCDEIGVQRVVLKVWMHNNKNNTLGRRDGGEDESNHTNNQVEGN